LINLEPRAGLAFHYQHTHHTHSLDREKWLEMGNGKRERESGENSSELEAPSTAFCAQLAPQWPSASSEWLAGWQRGKLAGRTSPTGSSQQLAANANATATGTAK